MRRRLNKSLMLHDVWNIRGFSVGQIPVIPSRMHGQGINFSIFNIIFSEYRFSWPAAISPPAHISETRMSRESDFQFQLLLNKAGNKYTDRADTSNNCNPHVSSTTGAEPCCKQFLSAAESNK